MAVSTLVILSFINTISFILVLSFMNPFDFNPFVSVFIFWFTAFFSFVSLFSLIFYSIKRIHLRWITDIFDVTNSVRQSLIFALFIISLIIFQNKLILTLPIFLLLAIIFLFLELLINNLFWKWKK